MPGLRYPVLHYEILNELDLDDEESAQTYFGIAEEEVKGEELMVKAGKDPLLVEEIRG